MLRSGMNNPKDFIKVYFRGSDDCILGTYKIESQSDQVKSLIEASDWFVKSRPNHAKSFHMSVE